MTIKQREWRGSSLTLRMCHRNRNQIVGCLTLLVICTFFSPTPIKSQEAAKPAADLKSAAPKDAAEKGDDTYSTRLFLTNVDGSEPKQLTVLPGFTSQGSPEWSRDGKLICFDVWKMGGSVATGQIAVVNADGTKPRIIGEGVMPSFSPGGKRIAFSRASVGGVWITSLDEPDQEPVQLDAAGWGTSWAPDGRIAFAISNGGGRNLAVVDLVDGTRELLFDAQTSPYRSIYWNMAWSPDSKRIVFKGITREGQVEVGVVDSRGEKFGHIRRPYSDVHESFTWSADGSRILVTKPCPERENLAQVYSFNPDKDEPLELLPKQDPQRASTTAASSPDGKQLVISCLMPVALKVPAAKSP
jgi:TolB protein